MTISVGNSAFVTGGGQTLNLTAAFSITAGGSNPTYLVLNGLDRNEYTIGSSGATGLLNGNGHSALFGSIGDDGRGVGVVFTYQAASGRYYNSSYGYFDQITYTTSTSSNDVTNLSLFGTNSLSTANTYASDAYSLLQTAAFYGSATFTTQAGFGAAPAQATPNAIAKIAQSFVGKAWNANGCWTLASTIAADAGAGLPVDSTAIGLSGNGSGEWFVAFDGSKQSGNWQSLVKAGEMIVIGGADGGHITTCVSGSGSSAMLIDNITYLNASGQVVNSAHDGSASDVIVSAAHAASQEWSGVDASLVKIYQLDTPVVSVLVASDSLATSKSQALAPLFSAADPAGKAVTQYQVYDTAASDSLLVNGSNVAAHTADKAVSVSSLSAISLQAGSSSTTDLLEVRAFNGSYWGDWQTLNVTVGQTSTTTSTTPAPTASSAPEAPSAPRLTSQTASQVWHPGQQDSLTLAGNTFTDPQGQKLSYAAYQDNGPSITSWLRFNASTLTLHGNAPANASGTVTLEVDATNASGLTTADMFTITFSNGNASITHGVQLVGSSSAGEHALLQG